MNDKSYDKYLAENDQFLYDEHNNKKGAFLKQDGELFNEEDYKPGNSVQVKRVSNSQNEDWVVLVNGKEHLQIKGSRFSSSEREFFRTTEGMLFIIDGIKQGWSSVSEFKRQVKNKV